MRIGVVSFAFPDEYQAIVAPGTDSHRRYCLARGYDYLDGFSDVLDRSRPMPWLKIQALLKHMRLDPALGGYDWLFWLDADTIITNAGVRLEALLDGAKAGPEHDLVLTLDPRGSLNTGVFFVRNTPWARDFLAQSYEQKQFLRHVWYEQAAIMHLLGTNWEGAQAKAKIERRTWKWNSYPKEKVTVQGRQIPPIGLYHRGDFLVHFAGIHGSDLKLMMKVFDPTDAPPRIELVDWPMAYGPERDIYKIRDEWFADGYEFTPSHELAASGMPEVTLK